MIYSNSVEQTEKAGETLASRLAAGDVVLLHGGLGAGKTAFVRGLAAGLGINPETVSSPTFTFVREYTDGRLPLMHFDMYRISSLDDLYSIGFFDYLGGEAVLAIEWSENIIDYIRGVKALNVNIMHGEGENDRVITIEGDDD